MRVIDRKSALWGYLTSDIKGLIVDGELLIRGADSIPQKVSDYAYLVFPFAKAYEGFLKKLFLDLDFIKEDEYYGDEIRIGRILNPGFTKNHGNVFSKLCSTVGEQKELAEGMWGIWRKGRNQVFHYFPHNFRKLSYDEALDIVKELVSVMDDAAMSCDLEGK